MSDFKDILGNETLKNHFKTAIRQQKISHAYIIEGEKGSGKKMLAEAFAKILQCEQRKAEQEEACGSCPSCKQMESRNHPDVIWVNHEKPNIISVKEVREQIVNTIDVMPYKGPYKIYMIDEAEKMNIAAQNAVLKTIEEPPSYGIIFLLTTNRGAFLQTILSRCILLTVKPVPDQEIRKYLMEHWKIEKTMADFCVDMSMGNIGKAVDIALSEDFSKIREFSLSVLPYLHELEPYEIAEKVKQLKNEKEFIQEFLDMMFMWFRDLLVVKTCDQQEMMIFKEQYLVLKKQSKLITYEMLNESFVNIDQTRKRLRANVNFDSSLEVLFLTLRNGFKQ